MTEVPRPDPGTYAAAMCEFRDLLFAAGVTDAEFDKALEGRFIPFGAMGDEIEDFTPKQTTSSTSMTSMMLGALRCASWSLV